MKGQDRQYGIVEIILEKQIEESQEWQQICKNITRINQNVIDPSHQQPVVINNCYRRLFILQNMQKFLPILIEKIHLSQELITQQFQKYSEDLQPILLFLFEKWHRSKQVHQLFLIILIVQKEFFYFFRKINESKPKKDIFSSIPLVNHLQQFNLLLSMSKWEEARNEMNNYHKWLDLNQIAALIKAFIYQMEADIYMEYQYWSFAINIYEMSFKVNPQNNARLRKHIKAYAIFGRIMNSQPKINCFKAYHPQSVQFMAVQALIQQFKYGLSFGKEIFNKIDLMIQRKQKKKQEFFLYDYTLGLHYYYQLNYESSLQHFATFYNETSCGNALVMMACCCHRLQDYKLSLEYCGKLKQSNLYLVRGCVLSAINHIALGQYEQANLDLDIFCKRNRQIRISQLIFVFQVQSKLGKQQKVLKPDDYSLIHYYRRTLRHAQMQIIEFINYERKGELQHALKSLDKICDALITPIYRDNYFQQFHQCYFTMKMCFNYERFSKRRRIAKNLWQIVGQLSVKNQKAAETLILYLEERIQFDIQTLFLY